MEIEVTIRGLVVEANTNAPIVVLKGREGDSLLPIWVGVSEAQAIALELQGMQMPRPMTHDLIKSLLMGLDAQIKKVVVNELKNSTFYALIWLERDGKLMTVDSRPSDALALALRHNCPIYVEECVFQACEMSRTEAEKANTEELRNLLEGFDDKDVGGYKM